MSFNRVERNLQHGDRPTSQIAETMSKSYKTLLRRFQSPSILVKISSSDVALLYRAAFFTEGYTDNPVFVGDMSLDLKYLVSRNDATHAEYEWMYDALVGLRSFGQARSFVRRHPSIATQSLPMLRDFHNAALSEPTIVTLSRNGRYATRRSFDIRSGARVVIIASPLCHFARHSLHDIRRDPTLRVLLGHATWLVPPDTNATPVNSIVQWNRTHAQETMVMAYRTSEWPMFDRWELPTFYFLRDGHLVSRVIGWPKGGRKDQLRAGLRSIGLL